jgi:hypothetical protein
MTTEGWISVLKLATMWNFKDIRVLAINKLTNEPMESVQKILLAKTYMVPQWLRAGYSELALRWDVLSSAEAELMGYPTAILLFQVREKIKEDRWTNSMDIRDLSEIIEEIFEKEVQAMESVYNA